MARSYTGVNHIGKTGSLIVAADSLIFQEASGSDPLFQEWTMEGIAKVQKGSVASINLVMKDQSKSVA